MTNFFLIAFIGGFLTIAAPCILAVLPIILGSTVGQQNKLRPLVIVLGLTLSFTGFGVLFTYVTSLFGLSNNTLRTVALLFLGLFGLALIFPQVFEKIVASIQNFFRETFPAKKTSANLKQPKKGLLNAFLIGVSLGLVWVPCAGPILGAILTLAITQSDVTKVILLMLAYSLGAGLPMLAIGYGGNFVISRLKFLKARGELIQKISGVVLLLGVLLIGAGLDTKIATSLAEIFPQFNQLEEKILNTNTTELPAMAPTGTKAPEITGTQAWINSPPLTLAALKGKVVIVDFWTYSCINCLRTLPYLNTWHETYKDDGLVIIGVHTPEFAFEKELPNVQKAVKDLNIQYPVVQDNDYKTWQAYDNHYWPAKYIVDRQGNVRFVHFGEGEYAETEKVIQELLFENTQKPNDVVVKDMTEDVDFTKIATPETYLGYERGELNGNTETIKVDQPQLFTEPTKIETNRFYFVGSWTVGKEFVTLNKAGGKLMMNYQANKINLVAESPAQPVVAKVLLDGQPIPKEKMGKDVRPDGTMMIDKATLYNLVDTDTSYEKHTVTLEFQQSNARVYVFTFG